LSKHEFFNFVEVHLSIRTEFLFLVFVFLGCLSFVSLEAQTAPTLKLTAYNTDGTNSGTARLSATVSVNASIDGTSDMGVLWSVQGGGTISAAGVYQAPNSMPTNPQVTVTAALHANSSVTASYSMSLLNAVPTIYNAYVQNGNLLAGATNTVTIHGAGFVAGSVVLVNSTAVPTTYLSSGYLSAQVVVPALASGTVPLAVTSTPPGGGTTPNFFIPVVTPKLWLTVSTSDGTNTGTARISQSFTPVPYVSGLTNAGVQWTLIGAGSLSQSGLYQAPVTMPANPSVTITATLQAVPSVSTTYRFTLINAVPIIYNAYVLNGSILSGITNTVTIHGANFIPLSTVQVNSVSVHTTYQSSNYVLAQVPVASGTSGALAFQVQNPAPGGGTSPLFTATVAKIWLTLTALSGSGTNPTSIPVGSTLSFTSQLQGSGGSSSLPVIWTMSGAGTLSSTGLYQAPTTMPSSPDVWVKAALVANPSISVSYHFDVNIPPVITGTNPAQLEPGQTIRVTIYGQNFVNGTYLTLNGAPLPVSEGTDNSLLTSLAVPANQFSQVYVVAHSPDLSTAASAPFPIPVAISGATLSVQVGLSPGTAIPADFLGLSHEWTDPVWLIGNSAQGMNTAYLQMLRNLMLTSDYDLPIRLGGGSTDTAGEPSSDLGSTLEQLATTLPIHYMLSINLGANNLSLATDQAQFFLQRLPLASIQAFEIGNEPDEYALNGLRKSSYSMTTYLSDFARWENALAPLHSPSVPLMGPSWGEIGTMATNLSAFESQESAGVAILSQHMYAGYQEAQQYFPPDFLLSPASSETGPASVANAVIEAHEAHQLFRIGEINSIDGGGIEGISDTFGAALWSIDTMFRYASIGVDGVNWHGLSGCVYCPFQFAVNNPTFGPNSYTLTHTNPLYYGWLFFQHAVADGSRLLPVIGPSNPNISVYATLNKQGIVRVTIINKDKLFSGPIAISVAGHGNGSLGELIAPTFTSTSGVTLFGQSFDRSVDGFIQGTPTTVQVTPVNGVYTINEKPISAFLLTLSP
jgi:hypothetical protein